MINLYTDGGSDNNGGGASACIVQLPSETHCFSYLLGDATNNECEITAVLVGLGFIHSVLDGTKQPYQVRWISDSEYSLKGATQYINTWIKNGWRTSQKDPVKNQGLWKTYLHVSRGIQITPEHVRGHTGHPENEACDLAVNWVRKNKEYCDNDWIQGMVDIGDTQYEKWFVKDARILLPRVRSHDDGTGISKDELIDFLDFTQLKSISKTNFSAKAPPKEVTQSDIQKERLRITKSYLKKMDELRKIHTNTDESFDIILANLSEWAKKG